MSTLGRYRASILLGALGDTIGYHNGDWEFCYNTKKIRHEFDHEGGITKIDISNLIVSDDTVLHLATIRALIRGSHLTQEDEIQVATEEFLESYYNDMFRRAPGSTTGQSMALLKKGIHPQSNLEHKTCGGAMRASAIGLRYHSEEDYILLLWTSIEYCRLTHNGPIAYMGSFFNALFTSFAINSVPVNQWIRKAIETYPSVAEYIEEIDTSKKTMDYIKWIYAFLKTYQDFRFPSEEEMPGRDPNSPDFIDMSYEEDPDHMDEIYTSLSLEPDGKTSWSGSCGISSVLIAYDALLYAIYDNSLYKTSDHETIYKNPDRIDPEFFKNAWYLTVLCGMLHSGDNDSTGIIIGGWYGALFGARGVTKNLIEKVEYLDEMWDLAKQLHEISNTNTNINTNIDTSIDNIPSS